jgi:small subunit ribosomal protein S6
VNDYEILLMLDPETPEERHDEIIARTRELVEKGGGTWLSHDPWGRRRLAYEIDHKADGVYHLLQFDAGAETLDEVTRVLKITDGVMRHMATRRPKGGGRVAPPPQPAFEPEPAREPEPEPDREAVLEAPPLTEAESADSEAAPEEYAEPTASEPAPEAEPEGGA